MLYAIGTFSPEKKNDEENRARACIRICVICMFYKLSIGEFRMSAHFFSFYLSS